MALAAVSSGAACGARMAEVLKPVASKLKVVPIQKTVPVPHAGKSFRKDGTPIDTEQSERIETAVSTLIRYAAALREARGREL